MKTKAVLLAFALMVSVAPLTLAQTSGTSEPCFTQGQVVRLLESEGYSDIKLSQVSPTTTQPHPEISCRTPGSQAETTTTHPGWNGTAVKGGKTYDIMVDARGHVTTR